MTAIHALTLILLLVATAANLYTIRVNLRTKRRFDALRERDEQRRER